MHSGYRTGAGCHHCCCAEGAGLPWVAWAAAAAAGQALVKHAVAAGLAAGAHKAAGRVAVSAGAAGAGGSRVLLQWLPPLLLGLGFACMNTALSVPRH